MSAGICGKRPGLEDIFGSPTSPPSSSSPSHKRSRRSCYLDFALATDDKLLLLLQMFPSMDREVVESVLNSQDKNIDEAIKSLHTLCLGDNSARNEPVSLSSSVLPTHSAVEDGMIYQTSEKKDEGTNGLTQKDSSWVDLFVQEMTNASDWDDARGRTTKFLEAFEKNVLGQHTTSEEQQEIPLLKEQVQYLLRENQILKKAVAIQYGRNLENEEKLKEVQQLKHMISQYQEQVRTLELNNYTLKIHLQRSQGSNSMPGHFHPDIF